MLSQQTAAFLLGQINAMTLNVGAPDFDEALAQVLRARQELQAIVDAPTPSAEPILATSQMNGHADTSSTPAEA